MYSFKQFLVESSKTYDNEAILVLHRITDKLDSAHVDKETNGWCVNIGKMIKDKNYYNLDLVVRKSDSESIKLVKNKKKEGYSILIDCQTLPSRMEIDSFLKKESSVNGFKARMEKFLKHSFHKENGDVATDEERAKRINSPKDVEKLYDEIIQSVKNKIKDSDDAIDELENTKKEVSGDLGDGVVTSMAKKEIKKSFLGKDEKSFIQIALKDHKKEFDLLHKEFKEKIESRLKDFYKQKVSSP